MTLEPRSSFEPCPLAKWDSLPVPIAAATCASSRLSCAGNSLSTVPRQREALSLAKGQDRHLMIQTPVLDTHSSTRRLRRLCPTALALALPRRIVTQSHPRDTKPRRLKRHCSIVLQLTFRLHGKTSRAGHFASSQAHLSSWPNPHSTRGTTAAHTLRFRALALFGRRLSTRVDSIAIPASS